MNDLIVVKQLPVIEEQLLTLKSAWEQRAADAESMICNEGTIQAVKKFRAEMRNEFEAVESLRKEVKKAVMGPYEKFEAVYKDCVTTAFKQADSACACKISEVESEQKRRCEEGLRDYFAELCAVHHLDWLKYEQAGIRVDMASAKAKTPSKLRKQLFDFVADVEKGVRQISGIDGDEIIIDEIMVEYQKTLDAAGSIFTVQERHHRIEEERAAQEFRKAAVDREEEAVRRVEALAPPVQVEPPKTVKCVFTVRTTMEKLKKLKAFLEMEGIEYE